MAALGFSQFQGKYVVVYVQQLGHLTNQFVLYALGGELIGLHVELREHFLEEFVEILELGASPCVTLPGAFTRISHD